jgi:tetratricopeptide (TPR) repeat protein
VARHTDFDEENYRLQKDDAGLNLPREPRSRHTISVRLLVGLVLVVGGALVVVALYGNRAANVANGPAGALWATLVELVPQGPVAASEAPLPVEATTVRAQVSLPAAAQTPTVETPALFAEEGSSRTMAVGAAATTPATPDVAQLFAQAEAAFAQEAWLDAIALYKEVRDLDATHAPELVNEHLATAYRNAALELLEADPENAAGLEMARTYLREAVVLNPADTLAVEEGTLLSSYLSGVRSLRLESPGEAIVALLDVYEARPDYLGGRAGQQLYLAYVAMGDMAFRRGETSVARELFERAAALGITGMDEADVRLASIAELAKLTPTPYPQNLATVQAVAVERRLPPVLLPTPTPANFAEATRRAEYATAVALTTGTFTPEPQAYVTPILIAEVARAIEATARADAILIPTATLLPYNAVMGEYVYATPAPENAATAEADAVIAQANVILYGTPTPLPWHAIVITPVPTLLPPLPTLPPTGTPVPLLVPVSVLTATPTPQPTVAPPDTFPPELRNKIVFLSDRGGDTQTYALDPDSGETSLITQAWVYPMAREQLALAPDGRRQAIVLADNKQILQIQIRDPEYNSTQQVTVVNRDQNSASIAYDPAWSPIDDVIAYASSETTGDEIYTVRIADGSTRRLTHNTWEWDKHPSWSPDGRRIVFYSNRDTGRTQLWIMNADGSEQRNLSSNAYNDWDPVWIR